MREYEDADDDIGADCEIEMTMAMLFHLLRYFFALFFCPGGSNWLQCPELRSPSASSPLDSRSVSCRHIATIPDYSKNISGRVWVLLKIIGSGRVSVWHWPNIIVSICLLYLSYKLDFSPFLFFYLSLPSREEILEVCKSLSRHCQNISFLNCSAMGQPTVKCFPQFQFQTKLSKETILHG